MGKNMNKLVFAGAIATAVSSCGAPQSGARSYGPLPNDTRLASDFISMKVEVEGCRGKQCYTVFGSYKTESTSGRCARNVLREVEQNIDTEVSNYLDSSICPAILSGMDTVYVKYSTQYNNRGSLEKLTPYQVVLNKPERFCSGVQLRKMIEPIRPAPSLPEESTPGIRI